MTLFLFSPDRGLIVLYFWPQGKVAKKGKTAAGGEDKDSGSDEKPAYVHVRARRGQATDSHSLAERVSSAFAAASPR